MDDGYQYLYKNHQKIFIVSCVKFWWMDGKWHQHDIMVVVIGGLHSSWKRVVAIELQWVALEWNHIYGELNILHPMQLVQ
jgi:hypothetical protein